VADVGAASGRRPFDLELRHCASFPALQEAVRAVEQHRSRFGTLAGAAEMLSRAAIDGRQSADNVTVLILAFAWDPDPSPPERASA
jgi:hypothetical protein